ncbi:MAG TPA: pectate lyase [Longimicrobiaceae bacterium]|nr:pectate lyase [Longimicrobiaceae bacterium]
MTRTFALLLLALLSAGASAAQSRPAPEKAAYLAPERIAALPAPERRAWERYLAESRRWREIDRRALEAELRAAGTERLTPAPTARGFWVEREMTPEWFRGEEARRIADAVVSFQTPAGGWSKRMELARPRRPGEGWTSEGHSLWLGTFDNDATTEQLRFLAGAYAGHRDPRYRAAFLRGLDYVLRAQFPNGCWPQVYPLAGSYHDAATFNDDAMLNVLRLLQKVGRGELAFVPEGARRRAREAVERGTECILESQVVVDGRRTLWGQQHDPLTLAPVGARSYEHASLSGAEGAGIFRFLMSLDAPDARVRSAVRGAAAWLRENALWGWDYHGNARVTPRPGAGPIWARFAEIGTNRPLFSNRDGVIRYDPRELTDRAEGYAWFTTEPAAHLREYEKWSRRHAEPALAVPAPPRVSAVVDAGYAGPEGARGRGVPTYRSIARAVADAPAEGGAPYVVSVRKGRYREKVNVERANVHLVGEDRDGTVLTYDAAAGMKSPGGWTYGTRGSWTLRVAAPGFRLENMTVENAFDYPGNAAKAETDPTRLRGTQAVAVMLDEGSDRAVFRDCAITGHQDTLFPNAGRSWFHRCTIVGSVDFIFGAGVAVFEESDLVSRDRGSRSNNGYVTAPSTPASQPYGFVFLRSRLRKERPEMAPASVALGRPWHPSGNPHVDPSAVFLDSWMDDHVGAEGWAPMNSRDAAGHQQTWVPEGARFFEHGTTGPRAVASPARRVLPPERLAEFSVERVLGGWDPRR